MQKPFIAAIALALTAFPGVSNARECATNFTEQGDWNTGMVFKSFLEIHGMSKADAVERVAQEMAIVGFQGLTVNKDVGIVSGYVSAAGTTTTSKQSPVSVVFRSLAADGLRIEIAFQLLGGLRTSPSAVRDEFCQILEAALPEDQRVAAAAAADSARPRLQTAAGVFALREMIGQPRKAGFGPVMLIFLDYQGARSSVRTSDQQPHIVITTAADPQQTHLLVSLEQHSKENRRSLKMGSAGKLLKMAVRGGSQLPPDKDWTLPFAVGKGEGGAWVLTPNVPLAPGEYGLFEIETGSLLYDFGIDG